MHRCEVSSAAGVGVDRGRYDVVGKRGEKACRPRHKREESALNITELRSNDDDIQGRGAWSFRPLAFNAVMAGEPAARIHSGKCPGFRGKAVHFPGNIGKLWTAENEVVRRSASCGDSRVNSSIASSALRRGKTCR